MKTPFDELKNDPPVPSPGAKKEAWERSLEAYRDPSTPVKFNLGRTGMFTMIAAALALVAAIMAILRPSNFESGPIVETDETREIFDEGLALFGDRLKAVTVSRNGVTWHLTDEASVLHSPQLIRVRLRNDEEMVTRAGQVVPISFQGNSYEVEFLEDADGKIVAIGDETLWEGDEDELPYVAAQLDSTSP